MMNKTVRKTIATICMGAAVLTLTPAVSWAETAVVPLNNQKENVIAPYMLYIDRAKCNLDISGSTATVDWLYTGIQILQQKQKLLQNCR